MLKHFSVCDRVLSRLALLGSLVLSVSVMASSAWAQGTASGTIHGTVKDETGGALPGVTATLMSPALQVRQVVVVTDPNGNYRFVDLPPATYRVTFELTGFSPVIREDLRLTVGFVARVDVTMVVGGVEESVTVSGQSPVVDLSTTSTSATLTKETLDSVPRGEDLWAVFAMVPGVTLTDAPDVGGSQLAERSSIQSFGMSAQPKLDIEGINVQSGAGNDSAVYLNSFNFEEIQYKTSGNDAEVGVPGVAMVAVVKSGSNEFHGVYEASLERPELQSSNLSDTLRAQGLQDTEPLKRHFAAAGDLGGRIIRDKLWFYGGLSRQERVSTLLGFAKSPGPDGRYLTGDDEPGLYKNILDTLAVKGSWQATKNTRLLGMLMRGWKRQPQNDAGRFLPLEATVDGVIWNRVYKGEIQKTINDRTLVNVVAGYGGYFADYSPMRTPFYKSDSPSRRDRETGLRTGTSPKGNQRPFDRSLVDGGISFFPENFLGGRHEMKTGVTVYWHHHATGTLDLPHGNYVLTFDRVGGVSGQPVEIEINNSPLKPENRQNTYAWYLKDSWRATDRVTVNLGVRWERQHSFLPEQSKEASSQFPTLFPAGSFPAVDILTWMRVLPRVGLAWNLDPNTVVKTTFGLYNYIGGADMSGLYNQNALVRARYRWRDLDGNGNYTPGEVNLDLNGPDFISIAGARNNILNPDLKQPMTTEVTASFERELAENLGVRAMYVFRRLQDFFGEPNVLRPREAYNIPITRRDPGPDGILDTGDDGGRVTFYDYDPAYRGAAFVGNQLTNSPNVDRFQSVEVSLTKRYSRKWMGSGSFWVVKNHRWLTRTFNGPNDEFFPVDESWSWAGNVNGSYRLPRGIQFAAFLQSQMGRRGQRNYTFRAVDPDGGPPIAQLSTVTLPLEPYGTQRAAAITVLNLRASKEFSLGRGHVSFDFDVFNVLNSSAPAIVTWRSGPTFGYVSEVLPARVARIKLRYSF